MNTVSRPSTCRGFLVSTLLVKYSPTFSACGVSHQASAIKRLQGLQATGRMKNGCVERVDLFSMGGSGFWAGATGGIGKSMEGTVKSLSLERTSMASSWSTSTRRPQGESSILKLHTVNWTTEKEYLKGT
eukprot:1330298-Amorphochlora_amoeboformis.AAC.1